MTAPDPREQLGRLVCEAWQVLAREQAHPDAKWLTGWSDLDEDRREVYMRIGEAVAAAALPDADPGPEDAGRDLRREALAVAYTAGRGAERERIAAWLERQAAQTDESGFDPGWTAPLASGFREAAEAIRCNMLESP
jgi:hypothetical protein